MCVACVVVVFLSLFQVVLFLFSSLGVLLCVVVFVCVLAVYVLCVIVSVVASVVVMLYCFGLVSCAYMCIVHLGALFVFNLFPCVSVCIVSMFILFHVRLLYNVLWVLLVLVS